MVNENATPEVAAPGAETVKCVAAAALTAIVLLVPVIDAVTVSVAVIVWLPAVSSVALNVPTPLTTAEFTAKLPAPSQLVKCTVPAYPTAMALLASTPATVIQNPTPPS